jgi:heat shock protein HtpX
LPIYHSTITSANVLTMNSLKTTLLLASLTGLLLAVGYLLGNQQGLTIALLLSLAMNIGSYWFSDKMVLKMYSAKLATLQSHPRFVQMVREIASSAGVPMPKTYIVDMPAPNAFATGRNESHSAVAISPMLMDMLSDSELKGVIAHEIGHIKNKDMLISTIAASLAGALSYLANMAYYSTMFTGSDEDNRGNALGAMVTIFITPMVASILQLSISRSREYLADEAGAKFTRNPHALADALHKIGSFSQMHKLRGSPVNEATAHLFISNPFSMSGFSSLFSTHPPMQERIKRLRAMKMR